MIYYFSGTGNSLYVARHLADALGERLCPMQLSSVSSLKEQADASVGLVFPVYAWGIPSVVEAFAKAFPKEGGSFLYAVMTCGDDMGYTDRVLEKALGRQLDAAFSVLMPDVYVCLPGFDVDSKEECREKFRQEETRVKEIAECVKARKQVRLLKRGPFPWLKTYVLRPLFNRYLVTDKYFRADASKCIACGRCSKTCPVGNIQAYPRPLPKGMGESKSFPLGEDLGEALGGDLEEAYPQWQSHCVGCLACYHACPYHAINFGKMTQHKGQYNLQLTISQLDK